MVGCAIVNRSPTPPQLEWGFYFMELQKQQWYESLVEECKAIITEAVFTSRWALVEGYWKLGERIREDELAQEHSKGNKTFVQDLARNLGTSDRTLYYALQAYDKFPKLDEIPEGKNITWNKLITKYLPEPKKLPTPELPEGKYQVIYADPPWEYGQEQHSKEKQKTVLETHYPTMPTEDICALPINELAADNSVLFLWTTSPKLFEAKQVIDAWGFEYKSSMIWDKVKHNVGYYVSVRHEFLLICTKGSCLPDNPKLYDSVQTIERTEHSKKPTEFYEIIEDIYHGKKIELFSRKLRKNWSSWGNEL